MWHRADTALRAVVTARGFEGTSFGIITLALIPWAGLIPREENWKNARTLVDDGCAGRLDEWEHTFYLHVLGKRGGVLQ